MKHVRIVVAIVSKTRQHGVRALRRAAATLCLIAMGCSSNPEDLAATDPPPPEPPPPTTSITLMIVEPAYVRFDKQLLSTAGQEVREILVRNVGTEAMTVSNVLVSGPFELRAVNVGAVMPGATTTIQVAFLPSGVGAFEGSVTVSSTSGADRKVTLWGVALSEIQTVPLTGPAILDQEGATYVLQNDITTNGTCFSVQASYITLDLNGHTIVYGNAFDTTPRHGVMSAATWGGAGDNPAGGLDAGLAIRNGTIRQGAGGGERSHAIAFYQMNSRGHYDISNLRIEVSGPSSVDIWVDDSANRGNYDIHHNTLVSNVTTIANRHQIDGTLVRIGRLLVGPDIVHDNTLSGGAQAGIMVRGPRTQVYRNDISQNGKYTNDFSVFAMGDGIEVFENTIHPISGRGIRSDHASCVIYGNTIDVTELKQNDEYGGCQAGGAYGIQLEDGATNTLVYKNTVLARAVECDAKAFRATNLSAGSNNLVFDNLFSAQRQGASVGGAHAISFAFVTGGVIIEGNRLVADTAVIESPWDGGTGVICRRNIFEAGANKSPAFVTVHFWNHETAAVTVLDTDFRDSAPRDLVKMDLLGQGGFVGSAEYRVDWTAQLTVVDGGGTPIAGAAVSIHDAMGDVVFSGSTGTSGKLSTVLTEFRTFNTTEQIVRQMRTPHTVTVEKGGRVSNTAITVDGRTPNYVLRVGS